jgi:hypothetical protein
MFAWLARFYRLPQDQRQILGTMHQGWTLKSHRYLDGAKIYRLHALNGEGLNVPASAVAALQQRRLIQSNQKFPAATFLLTEKGRAVAGRVDSNQAEPLSAQCFH